MVCFFGNHLQCMQTRVLHLSQATSKVVETPIEVEESQVEGQPPETIPATPEELEEQKKTGSKTTPPALSSQNSFQTEHPTPTSPGDVSAASLPSSYASGSSVICSSFIIKFFFPINI